MKIAIIGTGIAGISAAQLLHRDHEVEIFEKRTRLGGHTATHVLESGPDQGIGIDTGFIVCNNWTYPNFHRFLESLDVPVRDTDMSFGYYSEDSGLQYAGTTLNGLFAQRKNLIHRPFLRLVRDFIRFNKIGQSYINSAKLPQGSVREMLDEHNFSQEFIDDYLVPMGGAIWSSSNEDILSFPASLFLRFFKNHGLLNTIHRPTWQTVLGGSHSYLKSFEKQFQGKIHLGIESIRVSRQEDHVHLHYDGQTHVFDKVIFATHADQVLPILEDARPEEQAAFQPWAYLKNKVVLHTDSTVMPSNQRAWASWNFVRESGMSVHHPASLTYDMNRLQGLQTESHYLVTLNRIQPIPEDKIIKEFTYYHPNFTLDSLASVEKIQGLNGQNQCYFVGSYHGFGFHEDACKSSVDMVAQHFQIESFK